MELIKSNGEKATSVPARELCVLLLSNGDLIMGEEVVDQMETGNPGITIRRPVLFKNISFPNPVTSQVAGANKPMPDLQLGCVQGFQPLPFDEMRVLMFIGVAGIKDNTNLLYSQYLSVLENIDQQLVKKN